MKRAPAAAAPIDKRHRLFAIARQAGISQFGCEIGAISVIGRGGFAISLSNFFVRGGSMIAVAGRGQIAAVDFEAFKVGVVTIRFFEIMAEFANARERRRPAARECRPSRRAPSKRRSRLRPISRLRGSSWVSSCQPAQPCDRREAKRSQAAPSRRAGGLKKSQRSAMLKNYAK